MDRVFKKIFLVLLLFILKTFNCHSAKHQCRYLVYSMYVIVCQGQASQNQEIGSSDITQIVSLNSFSFDSVSTDVYQPSLISQTLHWHLGIGREEKQGLSLLTLAESCRQLVTSNNQKAMRSCLSCRDAGESLRGGNYHPHVESWMVSQR